MDLEKYIDEHGKDPTDHRIVVKGTLNKDEEKKDEETKEK